MSVSSLTSINRSILRLSGLSSGLDTESIVTGLLTTDQSKVDKQFQLKTKLEWKAEAYRDVNLLLKNFRQENMSVLNQDSNMFSASAFNIFGVTMLDTTSAVTVKAGSTATEGSMTIDSITQLAKAASASSSGVFTSDVTLGTALKDLPFKTALQFLSGSISFSINGKVFSFTEDTTLNDMLNTINNSDAGVTMRYSSLTKGFTLTSKTIGSASKIEIVNITGNAFADTSSAFGIAQGTFTGQSAILSINGISVTEESNSFTIDGITYTLKDESATPISFTVDRDIDATVEKIKTFIGNYNKMIETLQAKIDEETHTAYPPLTDSEREKLTDAQAEKWDALSKSGILYNDSNISSLLNTMRDAFYSKIDGLGMTAADIGLKTGIYSDKGKITVDETALRSALENNPDLVTQIFTKTSTAIDPAQKYNESGLISRISEAMTQYTETSTSVYLSNLETQISKAEERLDELMELMSDHEEKLYAKFTAMETALSKLNSQISLFSSLSSNSES